MKNFSIALFANACRLNKVISISPACRAATVTVHLSGNRTALPSIYGRLTNTTAALVLALIAFPVLLPQSALGAIVYTSVNILGQTVSDSDNNPVAGYYSEANLISGEGSTEGVTNATAGLGWLRADAFVSWSDGSTSFGGGVEATAGWSDLVTINNATLNGQAGTVTFSVRVDGSVVAGASVPFGSFVTALATSSASVTLNGMNLIDVHAEANDGPSPAPSMPGSSLDEFISVDVPIIFGQAFLLEAEFVASGYAEGSDNSLAFPGASSFGGADFSSTFEWQGISAVMDDNGNPVTGFQLLSESGTDWSQEITAPAIVPIPGAAWLFGSGLIGLLGVAKRKKHGLIPPLINAIRSRGKSATSD